MINPDPTVPFTHKPSVLCKYQTLYIHTIDERVFIGKETNIFVLMMFIPSKSGISAEHMLCFQPGTQNKSRCFWQIQVSDKII